MMHPDFTDHPQRVSRAPVVRAAVGVGLVISGPLHLVDARRPGLPPGSAQLPFRVADGTVGVASGDLAAGGRVHVPAETAVAAVVQQPVLGARVRHRVAGLDQVPRVQVADSAVVPGLWLGGGLMTLRLWLYEVLGADFIRIGVVVVLAVRVRPPVVD